LEGLEESKDEKDFLDNLGALKAAAAAMYGAGADTVSPFQLTANGH
jgi:hypothetical protein